MEVNLLLGFMWSSVIVVSLMLVFENIDSYLLRRNISNQDQKINELKAQLYEAQRPPSVPGVTYPTTSETRRPNSPPTTPPAVY